MRRSNWLRERRWAATWRRWTVYMLFLQTDRDDLPSSVVCFIYTRIGRYHYGVATWRRRVPVVLTVKYTAVVRLPNWSFGLNPEISCKFFFSLILVAQDLLFQNLPGALGAPLSVLRNSRWRPRWPPFQGTPYNSGSIWPRMIILVSNHMFWRVRNPLNLFI